MVIRQGELYWIDLGEPIGSEPGYRRPHVVVQNNVVNLSRMRTALVCALTSNLRRGEVPGNVTLAAGEGNLSRASVVVVSQLYTVDKAELTERIGSLSQARVRQIVAGIRLLIEPREIE